LLAVELVADHAAATEPPVLKLYSVLPLSVPRKEIVVEISGEEHAARGRRDVGDEGC
jgi:hypothetical protein